jgi:methylmalonyl-CoA/ethylmalonyl-CoA epimerase
LTDGNINLAILKSNDAGSGETPRDVPGYTGIDHLGFMVEDVEATGKKMEEKGAKSMMNRVDRSHQQASGPNSYYEVKYRGPDGQVIDITESGWVGAS